MDKSALLVLLCLQAFLLITVFTSADGAALVTDPQQPPDLVEKTNGQDKGTFGNRRKRYCDWRPGGCTLALGPAPTYPPPPPPAKPDAPVRWTHERDGQRVGYYY